MMQEKLLIDTSREAFYNSPESLAALKEAKQMLGDPSTKKFNSAKDLIVECLEGDDDD